MHFVKLFSFIFFIALALHIQQASAECCGCPLENVRCDGPFNCERICYDGNRCTPYCGRGSGGCNIFGCNCDGGCRTGTKPPIPLSPLESVFADLFKAADLNLDDLLSFEEWVVATRMRVKLGQEELRERWYQLVGAGKDFLTRDEAESIRA
ncbi:hypothetical protein BD779DRAFT_878039 [Infundibulicybe gibba]|nr:hypothetical protein BD779DRAFT_878039 [Infundibulicybe gibba]